MNKGEFVEALADRLDVSRAQADRALSTVLDIIAERMAAGEKVAFTGFGSFEISERAERTGRNPQTGASIKIAASTSHLRFMRRRPKKWRPARKGLPSCSTAGCLARCRRTCSAAASSRWPMRKRG